MSEMMKYCYSTSTIFVWEIQSLLISIQDFYYDIFSTSCFKVGNNKYNKNMPWLCIAYSFRFECLNFFVSLRESNLMSSLTERCTEMYLLYFFPFQQTCYINDEVLDTITKWGLLTTQSRIGKLFGFISDTAKTNHTVC